MHMHVTYSYDVALCFYVFIRFDQISISKTEAKYRFSVGSLLYHQTRSQFFISLILIMDGKKSMLKVQKSLHFIRVNKNNVFSNQFSPLTLPFDFNDFEEHGTNRLHLHEMLNRNSVCARTAHNSLSSSLPLSTYCHDETQRCTVLNSFFLFFHLIPAVSLFVFSCITHFFSFIYSSIGCKVITSRTRNSFDANGFFSLILLSHASQIRCTASWCVCSIRK